MTDNDNYLDDLDRSDVDWESTERDALIEQAVRVFDTADDDNPYGLACALVDSGWRPETRHAGPRHGPAATV
ncbi:MAG: hypothetical protein WAW85_07870 [Gordonia sp. (in: high G+C Gram-positive bacteria)]|uniref:hypothetical protein n=1 Tax=Gordonia sp. (in: high G+C Gram-positive bacteria) TaxID=84139 RepID=UPI003BB61D16